MKLALYGATGMIGSRILHEALARGHRVTAVVRDLARLAVTDAQLTVQVGDMLNAANGAAIVAGHAAVISAVGPGAEHANDLALAQQVVDGAHALIAALTQADVRRLLVVGGAGSLEVAPGVQLVDTPGFPAHYLPASRAHREALNIYTLSNLDWTFFSPPGDIAPGERSGVFRLGTNQIILDEQGHSRISAEDYAAAVLNEIEQPRCIRSQMTVAY